MTTMYSHMGSHECVPRGVPGEVDEGQQVTQVSAKSHESWNKVQRSPVAQKQQLTALPLVPSSGVQLSVTRR